MAKQQKGILGEKARHDPGLGCGRTRLVPVTVVKAGPCVVTQVRTPGQGRLRRRADRPSATIEPGARSTSRWPATSPQPAWPPRRHVVEIRTADASTYTVGQEITRRHLRPGRGPRTLRVGRSWRQARARASPAS